MLWARDSGVEYYIRQLANPLLFQTVVSAMKAQQKERTDGGEGSAVQSNALEMISLDSSTGVVQSKQELIQMRDELKRQNELLEFSLSCSNASIV